MDDIVDRLINKLFAHVPCNIDIFE